MHATARINPNTPHPLGGFRLTAGIDWVRAIVKLRKPTQHRHVRSRMMAAGLVAGVVTHIDAPHDRPARVVEVTIQDPGTPDTLMRAIQSVAPPGNGPILERDVQIIAVEIFLNASPRTLADHAELVDAALHLLRHQAHPPTGVPRATEPGHYQAASLCNQARRALASGLSINLGVKGSDYCARAYVKAHDSTPCQPYAPLTPSKCCARLEITLHGQRLPFSTTSAWRTFKFETLAGYFAMARPAPTNQLSALMLGQLTQLGTPLDSTKRNQHRRTNRTGVCRDTALNKRIADALRALTLRTRREAAPDAGIRENQTAPIAPHQRESDQAAPKVLNTLITIPVCAATRRLAHKGPACHGPTWATRPPHHHTRRSIPTEPRAPPLRRRQMPTRAGHQNTQPSTFPPYPETSNP